jgi:hypothetical protein
LTLTVVNRDVTNLAFCDCTGAAELEGPMTPHVSPCITEPSGQYLPEVLCLYTIGQLVDIRVITYLCIKKPPGGGTTRR